jgi:8-hydroxy-5-deazaflavin:NADPH oxidoreductase
MISITIVGAGEMAAAIARVIRRTDARVRILARRPHAAQTLARSVDARWGGLDERLVDDVVIFAVPSTAVHALAEERAAELAGRIVVDATCPFDPVRLRPLPSHDGSFTRRLQRLLPETRVVKAFSTIFAHALTAADPIAGLPVVLVAADDEEARDELVELVRDADVAAVPVGTLDRAVEMDALALLQAALADSGVISRHGGFALRY